MYINQTGMLSAKQRLLRTLEGRSVDRVPVYPLIPFAMDEGGFVPGPFHGYNDHDDWRKGDPLYWELVRRMETDCDNFFIWRPACMDAQSIFIPPDRVRTAHIAERDGRFEKRSYIDLDGEKLYKTEVCIEGTGHTWQTEHWCKTMDQALALLELGDSQVDCETESRKNLTDQLGQRGLVWVTVPSPLMAVCRLFAPQDFLMETALRRNDIDRLMEAAYRRIEKRLTALLKSGAGPIIRFGGAEHATPPIMSPACFDWLVVTFDQPLMRLCKQYGCKVAVHCHGNVRHALEKFMQMGVDQTDPVETSPFGDLTLSEARAITQGQITLTGNMQMRELMEGTPDTIRQRIREIIDTAGPTRLVVSAASTPLERITPGLYENYQAMIDAVQI